MQLEGRRIIVTGGSRGIGYRISELFLAEGAQVLAVSRSAAKLEGAKEQLPALATLVADVSVATDVATASLHGRRASGVASTSS